MQLPRIGPYELWVRLASGGAANVFLVRDLEAEPPGRLLALKVLLPSLAQNEDFLKMFFTEAKIASRLAHPNVVAIAGFGQVDGVHCLAMEYVFGASLSQVLRASARAQKPLSVGVLLSVTAAVCDALHYAHELEDDEGNSMGLVHRDVTPQNILIGFHGIPKLTDFGIAKATNRGWETQAGIVKGKFSYMSPEQALGKKVDRRSDIFGTGIVLWEALTGQDLFKGSTPMEVLKAIRELKIQAPSKVVEGLTSVVDDIVLKALRRPAQKRYASAKEMGEEIRSLIRKAGVTIDANSISKEFAAIYGDVIEKRALALRAAMAGKIDPAELARTLGAHELDARHLPRLDKALQDRDPLGLKARARSDSRVELDDEDLESLDEEESLRPGYREMEIGAWDDSTAMQVPDDELLALLSEADATAGFVPDRFRRRFHAEDEGVDFEDEMTVGHVAPLQTRPIQQWQPPSGVDGAGASSLNARPPSEFLRLDRPVPRAPSLDMETEATPAPLLEPDSSAAFHPEAPLPEALPAPDTSDMERHGTLPGADEPEAPWSEVNGAHAEGSVSAVVVIDDDGDTGVSAVPGGFDDRQQTPLEVDSPAPLEPHEAPSPPARVAEPDASLGQGPSTGPFGDGGGVHLPLGALVAGAALLLAAGIGIGFVLFGLG